MLGNLSVRKMGTMVYFGHEILDLHTHLGVSLDLLENGFVAGWEFQSTPDIFSNQGTLLTTCM